ncbi:GMP synthase [glutamine-hydrolyzing] [Neolecta irregularis DAH-3]|uniref:GMP synthase [glutamine-hydrolyzing] n=1 Tax=Neolecta irregularis (strain DAH-3) TaxID=1198029 RepID=A0A1U7LRX9_NEOID|nr:GMP synthase [glutamine-hydrolyzing] [Neolecta irregularis DAH-3]|eukprot:OLL25378.1 GMP synthase [glutamine-hydrolyzing] [Neolecta irregularis DAH-3]
MSMPKEVPTVGSGSEDVHKIFDTVLILDFGSQYSHLITRRLRELNVYAEMLPCTQKIPELDWLPKGIIFSGGPYSVYADGSPHVDPSIFELGIPILGICYGLQEIAWHNGRGVSGGDKREYGHADLHVIRHENNPGIDRLFSGMTGQIQVWMSHGDMLSGLPPNFVTIASTTNSPFAAIAHESKPLFGIQFHPEVTHSPRGAEIIKHFAVDICKCKQDWTMEKFINKEIERIRNVVGETGKVIGAISGGVDSTVAAKLMHHAIGDRFHGILVDNGCLRLNEAKKCHEMLTKNLGVNLEVVDASEEFLSKLKGVTDPEKKRKVIGNTFINVFERKALEITEESGIHIDFLLQGTLYPDNVGGLLKDMKLKLIEPLRELFKDEVRALGTLLGIKEELVWRHPFPGPGIAIRVLGEVTAEQVDIARRADNIFIEEIRNAGIYREISQAFAALLPVRAVGVMGDQRTYEQVIALRAVTTVDFMTADWYDFDGKFLRKVSSRIINEVKGVNRVVYDVSTKPPATVEWE